MKKEIIERLQCPFTKEPLVLKDAIYKHDHCLEGTLFGGGSTYKVKNGYIDFVNRDEEAPAYNLPKTSYVDKLVKNGWNYKDIATMDGLRFNINKLLESYLENHVKGHVLEIGSGGNYLKAIYSKNASNWVSSDYDVRSKIDIRCDAMRLPFNDGVFDLVVCIDVLEHVPLPVEMMQEIARVLSPGGKLILSTPFFFYLHEAPYDFYRFSSFGLRTIVENSGLNVLEIKPTSGFLMTIGIVITAFIVHLFHRIPFFCNFLLFLNKWFQRLLLPLDKLLNKGGRFSQGHFVLAQKNFAYH